MIKLAVAGACGKMGKRILTLALADKEFEIKAALDARAHPCIGKSADECPGIQTLRVKITDNQECIKDADVVIDFSSAQAASLHLKSALTYKKPLVLGTTGLSDIQLKEIKDASNQIPIVFAPNMSLGVNIVFELLSNAANLLKNGYKVSIKEAHHIHKKDAPSGTAKKIAEIISSAQNISQDSIEIDSIREGEIVGDHEVTFESEKETITITHHAKTRDILAQGALEAAKFVVKQNAGLFGMDHVIRGSEK